MATGLAPEPAALQPSRVTRLEVGTLSRRSLLRTASGWMLGAATLGAAGCGNGNNRNLVVYSAGPGWLAELAAQRYQEATGRAVEVFQATTGQVMAKLQAERYNRRADVLILASTLAADYLRQESMLEPYRPEGKPAADGDDPGGAYHTSSSAAVGIALRQERDTPNPPSWEDMLTGRFGGSVVMPAPSRSGTAADFVLNFVQRRGDEAWRMLAAAKQAGMEIGGANSQAIGGLLTGAYDALFAAADYLILRQIERGAPIRLRFPTEGVPVVHRPIAILRGTRLPDQARTFVDLYFAPALQQSIAEGHLIPALPGVPLSAQRIDAGALNAWPMDIAAGTRDQSRVLRRFQYEIERAVV